MNVGRIEDGAYIKARNLQSRVVDALDLNKWFEENPEKKIISVDPVLQGNGVGLWVLVIWKV